MKIKRILTSILACALLMSSIPLTTYATTSGNTGGGAGSSGQGGGGHADAGTLSENNQL